MVFVLAATAIVYFFTIRYEERRLTKEFGNDYTEYAADVPAIVPKITSPGVIPGPGPVPASMRWFVRGLIAIMFIGAFEVKEEIIENVFGIQYDPMLMALIDRLSAHV